MKGKIQTVLAGLVILVLGVLGQDVGAVVSPTSEFYVKDDAEILSRETEEFIVENSKKLAEAQGAQIVVVTVKNMEGETVEEYANELFNTWGIGDEKEDNGLLILFALEERKSRVEIGDGLAGYITDGMSGRMQDEYMIPLYKENKFEEGLKNGYSAFYAEVAKHYGEETEISGKKAEGRKNTGTDSETDYGIMAPLAAMLFGPPVAVGGGATMGEYLNAKRKMKKAKYHDNKQVRKKVKPLVAYGWTVATIMIVMAVFVIIQEVMVLSFILWFIIMTYIICLVGSFDSIGSGGGSSGSSSSGDWSSGGDDGGFSDSGSSGGGGSSSGGGSSRGF